MKLIKFMAILVSVLLFESFFIIGVRLTQPEEQIKYVYLQKEIPKQTIQVIKCPFNKSEEEVTVFGVGVHDDNKTGELIDIHLKSKPGEGRIYFDTTTHLFGATIQESIPIILSIVEKQTNTSLSNEDLFINLNSLSREIDGSSASSAMAVGLIALLENKKINNSMVLTGTLSKTGRILTIDGLDVKIKVAEEKGMKKILIPEQQCNDSFKNISIQTKCVDSIEEAVKEMTY